MKTNQNQIEMMKVLHMGLETSLKGWKLAFGTGKHNPRLKSCNPGDKVSLARHISEAKKKFGLSADTPVYSCYEAGRDGFWIHRFLTKLGVQNIVVDPASIEVPRQKRRAKTDKIDARKLLQMLIRHYNLGEEKIWRISEVPSKEAEDDRRLHRELERLKKEHTGHCNRIRGLLALHGVKIKNINSCYRIKTMKDWDKKPLPKGLCAEIKREYERLLFLAAQIESIEKEQLSRLKVAKTISDKKGTRLFKLRGIGTVGSWVLSKEFFGWRTFRNRRQVGSLAGLTGTPYASGDSYKEQGISKAGNSRVRSLMVELSWGWLRYQPDSYLSKWFRERFGSGGKRMRRIGIVALARKLLIALWKFVEQGIPPEGATFKKA